MKNQNSKNEYLMAINLGTANVKVAIYNLEGAQVVFKSVEYMLSYPKKY